MEMSKNLRFHNDTNLYGLCLIYRFVSITVGLIQKLHICSRASRNLWIYLPSYMGCISDRSADL